jgi:competence protein ComEC
MSAPRNLEMVPMLRLVPALALGILAGRLLEFSWQSWAVAMLGAGIAGFGLMFSRLPQMRYIYISGGFFLLALFFGGAALYQQGKPSLKLSSAPGFYSGKIQRIIKEDSLKVRAIVLINAAEDLQVSRPVQVLALLETAGQALFPDDQVFFQARITPIAQPANPGQFDMASYYGHKWINYQTWVSAASMEIEASTTRFSWRRSSYLLSRAARARMQEYLEPETAATLQAILLGVKHEISREMLSTYQNAGVMHILAVSGMHVMIIYGGLLWLMKPLRRKAKYFSWLPIILIWIFAFVTGTGAAVLRASLMLTLVDIGMRTANQSKSVNLLLGAALLLLMFQPYLLWDIGFQLSYAAMGGIFLFFKPLSDTVYFPSPLARKLLWSPSVLSVSAQLGTTPLTLYYFGVFPVYFLLSNILVLVPVILIMYSGIIWLLTSLLLPPVATGCLSKPLNGLIEYGFNRPLVWLESLPHSYLRNLHIEPFQVVMLVASVLLFAAWIHDLRRGKWLLRSLLMLLPVIAFSQYRYWKYSAMSTIIIPDVRGHHAVAAGYAGKAFLWTDSILMKDSGKADFSLNGMLKVYPWKRWTWLPDQSCFVDSELLVAGGRSFLRLEKPLYQYHAESPIPVDVLFLSDQLYLDTARLKQLFDPGLVVLSGEISHRKRQLFTRLLEGAGIPLYDIKERGALTMHYRADIYTQD